MGYTAFNDNNVHSNRQPFHSPQDEVERDGPDDAAPPRCPRVTVWLRHSLIERSSIAYNDCQRRVLAHHRVVLGGFLLSSLLLTTLLYYFSSFAAATSQSGSPEAYTCHDVLWLGYSGCGHMGEDCAPFASAAPSIVRCAARCDYYPYFGQRVIGVNPHYRADSYVCASAIHAGAIGSSGGCVAVQWTGTWGSFPSVTQFGISSVEFLSWFPKSFSVAPAPGSSHCAYFHWAFLWLGLLLFLALSLLQPPPMVWYYALLLYGYYYTAATMDDNHTQEAVFFIATERLFYTATFAAVMAHLGPLVTLTRSRRGDKADDSDDVAASERAQPTQHATVNGHSREPLHQRHVQEAVSASPLLPAAEPSAETEERGTSPLSSCASRHCRRLHRWWTAHSGAPFTLHKAAAHPAPWYELFFLYAVPYFAALHWGYLTLFLPDVDLNSQAFTHGIGGLLLVAAVSVVVLALVVYQVRLVYAAGLVRLYLALYGVFALVVLYVSLLWRASYSFHLHHVLIGPLLFPFTRFRTRLSLLCQALLLGLFVNGFALWGFDSDWDYDPPPAPPGDPVDSSPPGALWLSNASATWLDVEWEWRNDSGSSIGSVLYINGVEGYHAAWLDTQRVWNDTGPWNAQLPPMFNVLDTDSGVYDNADGRVRRYPSMSAARAKGARNVVVVPQVHPMLSSHQHAHNSSDGAWFARARLSPLLPALNYTVYACYLFTYAAIGPCNAFTASTLSAP